MNRPRDYRRLANQSEGYAGTDRQGHLDLGGWICRDVLRTTCAFLSGLVQIDLAARCYQQAQQCTSVRVVKTAPSVTQDSHADRQTDAKAYKAFPCAGRPQSLARPTCVAGEGRTEVKVGADALRKRSRQGDEDVEITADTMKRPRAVEGRFDREMDAGDGSDGAVRCGCWLSSSWCRRGCLGERDFKCREGVWCRWSGGILV